MDDDSNDDVDELTDEELQERLRACEERLSRLRQQLLNKNERQWHGTQPSGQ